MAKGKGHPAVVLVSKFVTNSDKKFSKFIDYIDRTDAVRNAHFRDYSAYVTDYMDNPQKQLQFNSDSEKSSALFSETSDKFTDEQKAFYKKQFALAQENGSILWQNVISFRNDWLAQQNLYDAETGLVDEVRLRNVTREAMRVMLKNEGMEKSVVWTAALHFNTDNLHIHIAVAEPFPQREEVIREGIPQRKGRLKQSTLDKMKSEVANRIVDRSEELAHINALIRDNIIASRPSDAFMKDQTLRSLFLQLHENLPSDQRQWKYGMNSIKRLRPQIDELSRAYILEYQKPAYQELQAALDRQEVFLKSVYGEGKTEQYKAYRKTKMEDLYKRMGNSILTELRRYDHAIRSERYQNQKAAAGSFKTGDGHIYSGHAAHLLRHAARNRELDRAVYNLKQALKTDFESVKNQRAYEQLQRREVEASLGISEHPDLKI